MKRVPGVLVWPRAAVVGLLAGGLGTVGHVSADGLLPGPAVVVGVLAVSVALSAAALQEQASTRRLAVLLVLGQAWVHLALSAAAGHRADPSGGPAGHGGPLLPVEHVVGSPGLGERDGRRVGSLMDAYHAGLPAPAEPTGAAGGGLLTHAVEHAPMMAAHLLVAVLVALWLAGGERALWTLLALSAGVLLALLRPLVPIAVTAGGPPAAAPDLRRPGGSRPGAATPLSRRGPPRLLEPLPTSCR